MDLASYARRSFPGVQDGRSRVTGDSCAQIRGSPGCDSRATRPNGVRCKLIPAQVRELEAVLDAGPAAWGWEDQCWTLARIGRLVRDRFGIEYTLAGLDVLQHLIGWSVQVPARRGSKRISIAALIAAKPDSSREQNPGG
jgi:Winged helix-turn helix